MPVEHEAIRGRELGMQPKINLLNFGQELDVSRGEFEFGFGHLGRGGQWSRTTARTCVRRVRRPWQSMEQIDLLPPRPSQKFQTIYGIGRR
jgi:hypothetical protein